jgi:hypothetical protein
MNDKIATAFLTTLAGAILGPVDIHLSKIMAPTRDAPAAGHQTAERLATFRRKIDVFGRTVNGFGRAKTAGLPAVFFEGLW